LLVEQAAEEQIIEQKKKLFAYFWSRLSF